MKASAVTLGNDPRYKIVRIPTGSLTMDRLTGGGFARGRHHALIGDWQVGKSLVVYMTLALAQQRGETAMLIDAEGVFDAKWFRALGGDPDALVLYPNRDRTVESNANELGNVLRLSIQRDGADLQPADVIGIDSVASLLPKEEEDHDLEDGDPRVASLARLMPLLLRMLTTKNGDTAFLWTNQWRDKISRIPGLRSSPGGRSLGFFASTIIEMQEGEKETEPRTVVHHGANVQKKVVLGRWVTCTARKEKTGARPEAVRSFMLDYDTHKPNVNREIVDLGMEDGLIERSGDYYTVRGDKRIHGIKRLVTYLESNEEERDYLIACIQERSAEMGGESGS